MKIVTITEVQKFRCLCGGFRCGYCDYTATGGICGIVKMLRCPSCGYPTRSRKLGADPNRLGAGLQPR